MVLHVKRDVRETRVDLPAIDFFTMGQMLIERSSQEFSSFYTLVYLSISHRIM